MNSRTHGVRAATKIPLPKPDARANNAWLRLNLQSQRDRFIQPRDCWVIIHLHLNPEGVAYQTLKRQFGHVENPPPVHLPFIPGGISRHIAAHRPSKRTHHPLCASHYEPQCSNPFSHPFSGKNKKICGTRRNYAVPGGTLLVCSPSFSLSPFRIHHFCILNFSFCIPPLPPPSKIGGLKRS
jgi:hypothetical protein